MTLKSVEDIRIDLESRIAFQEKVIADLNESFVNHTRMMLDLKRRVELLESIVRGFSQSLEAFAESPPEETPPHY